MSEKNPIELCFPAKPEMSKKVKKKRKKQFLQFSNRHSFSWSFWSQKIDLGKLNLTYSSQMDTALLIMAGYG